MNYHHESKFEGIIQCNFYMAIENVSPNMQIPFIWYQHEIRDENNKKKMLG